MPTRKNSLHSESDGNWPKIISHHISNFLDFIFHPKIGLEQINKTCSEKIDSIIIQEAEKGNTFMAGRFYVTCQDRKLFSYNYKIYFQTPMGEYLEVVGDSEPRSLDNLLYDDAENLRVSGEIVYEIDPPEGVTSHGN